jgi:putative methyltransferase (TIGR04325 family)
MAARTAVPTIIRRARISQIRLCSSLITGLARLSSFRSLMGLLMDWSLSRSLCHLVAGYRRPFSTLAEARAFAACFLPSHEIRDNIQSHLAMAERARPSDYAALFYLRGLLGDVSTVLDLGGNAGNLFYCYSRYLVFPKHLKWIVYDLPTTIEVGRDLAQTSGESRLAFTPSLAITDRVDLLLVSGSLHYFDEPLSTLMAHLPTKPEHVLINRTPLMKSGASVTVQDGRTLLTACKLLSIDMVATDLKNAGYALIDSWDAPELSLHIPFHPELSVPSYTGMYWRLVSLEASSDSG